MNFVVRHLLFTTCLIGLAFSARAQQVLPALRPEHSRPDPVLTYDSLGGAGNDGDSFMTGGPVLANAVLTPRAQTALAEIVLSVKLKERDLGSFDIFVSRISSSGEFYSTRVIGNIPDKFLTRDYTRIKMSFGGSVPLSAHTLYYVGISKRAGAKCTVILENTVDPKTLAIPEVAASAYFYNKNGRQPNSRGLYEMRVAMR